VDLSICLKLLGLPYPEYLGRTTASERRLYRLFVTLEAAKEGHAVEQQQARAEAERQAHAAAPSRGRS